ncbi:MAG: hypothetical protein RL757_2792 [Bacteroidota bacterium]|jgi:hypothetical protein
MRLKYVFSLFFFHYVGALFSQTADSLELKQENFQTDYQMPIKKAVKKITIDGKLDETDWQSATTSSDFWEFYPRRDGKAKRKTTARLVYDNDFLYVSFVCEDSVNYVISTLKRDVGFWDSDGVCVILDPINTHTNSFRFGVSPYGVQSDALIGAPSEESEEWDTKWYAETQRTATNWTVEIAIPFKSLRYDVNKTTWGIQFVRNDTKHGQYHTWTPVPVQFDGIHTSYTGALVFDAKPPAARSNVTVLPYFSTGVDKDYTLPNGKINNKTGIGVDAKIALTPSLNVDLTLNPDFSQVDVDEQVTNLTRFDVQFPERRPFFLENSDILSQFGIPPARPFWSRTIGLDDNRRAVPILYGLRLSGNVNPSLRVNAMNLHTISDFKTGEGQNFTAVAGQQALDNHGSFFKGLFLNRQTMNDFDKVAATYSRNYGAETYVVTKNQKWGAWFGYHLSAKPNVERKSNAMGSTGFEYKGENLYVLNDFFHSGKNFYNDMGFNARIENYDAARDTVIRLGFRHNYTEINYTIRPKSSKLVNVHVSGVENFGVWNTDGSLNEWFDRFRHFITFKNTSELKLRLDYNFINLPFATEFLDGVLIQPKRYHYWTPSIEYSSDTREKLLYGCKIQYGGFYGGKRSAVVGNVEYRFQPYGVFSLGAEYNELQFLQANEVVRGNFWLIQPKLELNFNRNFFWTTFLQFNTQNADLNINSRVQWRFRPMSDFFLVYSDDYLTTQNPLGNRLRLTPQYKGLVMKINYWLNL